MGHYAGPFRNCGSTWRARIVGCGLVMLAAAAPAAPTPTTAQGAAYIATTRTLVSSGVSRSLLQAVPVAGAAGKPLVIVLHGDGGTGSGIRAALALEGAAAGAASFVYPNAPGGTFEYFSSAGRQREVQFVRDLVNLLDAELAVDRTRVFLAGFSGGGTMANALACRLESDEIRAVAVNAGSLYPIDNDFTYTGNGGLSCDFPAAMLLWGEADQTPGVNYSTGVAVRNNLAATHACTSGTTTFAPAPCVLYDACVRDLGWCSVPGLGHSLWAGAATATWAFFQRQGGAPQPTPVIATIYGDELVNGWQNFSWGTVDFAHTSVVHSGARSIRFDAHSFQGLSFARPAQPVSTALFPELRLQIRGATGGESLLVSLQSGGTLHANVPLAGYVSGGAIAAGQWREVRVRFADPPMNYTGSFERINLQDALGPAPGSPQVILVDQVELWGGTAMDLLADGFED